MVDSDTNERPAGLGDPARLIALADGVFAIVMTLLVLELQLPAGLSEEELYRELIHHLPSLLAYVFAFLLAGEYWIYHRHIFNGVRGTTLTVVVFNIGFLLLVALIPFGASLIGNYPQSRAALFLYGVLLTLLEGYRLIMSLYITRKPGVFLSPWAAMMRRRVQVMVVAVCVFAASLALVPFLPPLVILLVYGITPLGFFLAMGWLSRRVTGTA